MSEVMENAEDRPGTLSTRGASSIVGADDPDAGDPDNDADDDTGDDDTGESTWWLTACWANP